MNIIKKGFTLIELLVVIGILAVLMAGVVTLINPSDKLKQANDSKVQSDVGQIATAAQSFAALNSFGSYPTTAQGIAILESSGELQKAPVQPSGAAYVYAGLPVGCLGTAASPCTDVRVGGTLTSQKYSATPAWVWCASSGKAAAVANTNTCPP